MTCIYLSYLFLFFLSVLFILLVSVGKSDELAGKQKKILTSTTKKGLTLTHFISAVLEHDWRTATVTKPIAGGICVSTTFELTFMIN